MADPPLRIKIPKRVWPAARPSDKDLVIADVRRYLNQLEVEHTIEMRTYYSYKLFRCIYKQPILIATDRNFRNVVCEKVLELEKAALKEEKNDYTEDFLDAAHEVIAVLCEIHEHPAYVE